MIRGLLARRCQSREEVETVRSMLADGYSRTQALASGGLGLPDVYGEVVPVLPPGIELPREKVLKF